MSDTSNVEVFVLAAVCEEVEKKKEMWMHGVFVSRCNDG
jgi:hypothetical protein